MKDINSLYKEARKIVISACGDVILPIMSVKISKRMTRTWGLCRKNYYSDTCEIVISHRILKDEVPYNSTMSTMIHEVLHACEGGHGHTGAWAKYAKQVMAMYPQYQITRLTPSSYFNLEEETKEIRRRYGCECKRCGKIIYKSRKTKFIKNPSMFLHSNCGGSFKRII